MYSICTHVGFKGLDTFDFCSHVFWGRFSFVRTDRPDHSSHDKNFAFNQNYPARSVRSQIACTKEMVFLPQLLKKAFFIVKMTGPVMVRPVSSDFGKAPWVNTVSPVALQLVIHLLQNHHA